MRYMASIYVSDVLDLVAATVTVEGWEESYGPPERAGEWTCTWPGLGEVDPGEWLGRALFLLAEKVSARPLGAERGRAVEGGAHTLSETGDRHL